MAFFSLSGMKTMILNEFEICSTTLHRIRACWAAQIHKRQAQLTLVAPAALVALVALVDTSPVRAPWVLWAPHTVLSPVEEVPQRYTSVEAAVGTGPLAWRLSKTFATLLLGSGH